MSRQPRTRSIATVRPSYEEEFPDNSDLSDEEFPYKISLNKSNKGGKSVPNQGRINTSNSFSVLHQPREQPILDEKVLWVYAVVVNRYIYERKTPQQLVNDYATQLMSASEAKGRLAIIIGNNEHQPLDGPKLLEPDTARKRGSRRTCRTKKHKKFKQELENTDTHDLVVLFNYFSWQSNWIDRKTKQSADIAKVDEEHFKMSQVNPVRAQRLRRYEKKRAYFPFGAARSYTYNTEDTQGVFNLMRQRVSVRGGGHLYVLNQDSDYINLNVTNLFCDPSPLTNQLLLQRVDSALESFYRKNRRYPLFFGGGHNYDPEEDITYLSKQAAWKELDLSACKMWTRFASELGNKMKALVGSYQPYGLYFHEPFSLFYWQGDEHKISFGPDSEMLDFYRRSFKPSERSAVVNKVEYSSDITITTSQKRTDKPFTIRFKGKYNAQKFYLWTDEDLRSLQGMSQEIFTSNEWANVISTSYAWAKEKNHVNLDVTDNMKLWGFRSNRQSDARKVIAWLYNLYDPHYLAYRQHYESQNNKSGQDSFLELLPIKASVSYPAQLLYSLLDEEKYNQCIPDGCGSRKPELTSINQELTRIYGNKVAEAVIKLAKETGELRRKMLHSVLANPKQDYEPLPTKSL